MPEKPQDVDKLKELSEQIQKLLEESGCALQPFLSFSEHGVLPRVHLVETNQEADEQKTNTEEAGADEGTDKPADAKQS